MPTGMSPDYVMRTPDFCLPVLTPQNRQRFVPDLDSAVAQLASPAIAGASLILTPLPQATAEAPAVSSAASTAAAGSPAGPIAAPTACIAAASVEAAEQSAAPIAASIVDISAAPGTSVSAQTPAGAIAASSAAAGVMPASATAAKTDGHGPFTDVPLFCGAQKRAASANAQQVHTLK